MAGTTLGMAFRHLRDLFGAGTVGGLGDAQLLVRFASSNDEVAFEALVARHGPMVLATCRAVLRNEHDVEDAFQTTFLVLAKKAHSVRGGDALGGWLHRVAFRVAVAANVEAKRRRRKEAEASAMAPLHTYEPALEPVHDLRPILHEEINRLPESQRLPVVLCELEGLTYKQAAEQLRWTVPTLRCRLAKARQRLKSRLTRRGFAGRAMGAAYPPEGILPTVPAGLVRSTVVVATGGGPISAGVALLTHAILRKMLMTNIKFATSAALAALVLVSAGVLASGGGRPGELMPATNPRAVAASVIPTEPADEKPHETVEVNGRVVAPDGRPVAGASVRAAHVSTGAPAMIKATSGPDGRFSVRLPKPAGDAPAAGELAMYPWLVASAPGYGVGWSERALRADRPAGQVVKLVEEGPPIEGFIVDLEGRPVAGAQIRAASIWYDEHGDLAGWIAKARNGAAGNLWQGLESLSLDEIPSMSRRDPAEPLAAIAATTGADGRFKLTGIGRDRIANLIVSGPRVATTQVDVFSRLETEIRSVDRGMVRNKPFIVRAPKFQLALAPARRVEGVFRDKSSGKPIAGLEIQAAVYDEGSLMPAPGIEATTDDKGRCRIDGLARAAAYRLFVKTAKGLPYTNATFKVPAGSTGLEPITFDIGMMRGVFVRGRVLDKVSGRPIEGAVNYFAFANNPNVREFNGFSESYEQYAYLDEQGRYEIVALPGRGLIAVQTERYRPATGYEKIAGYQAENQFFDTLPEALFPGGHSIIAEVVVDPKAESVALNLQADPGKLVRIEVVGPDGAPIGDTKIKGMNELYQTSVVPQPLSRFEVFALDPSRPRRVIVTHEGRKLIGTALLKGDEAGPVTIKLQPWGAVAGRIIDDHGQPRKGMFISSPDGSENKHPETHDILPGSDWNQGVRVGDDGRFLIVGLVPALKYSATSRAGFEPFGDLFVDVTVAPGEVKDLDNLKVQPPKKTAENPSP
jgi:RNA polymerase sigma factor (sigma-70 family)